MGTSYKIIWNVERTGRYIATAAATAAAAKASCLLACCLTCSSCHGANKSDIITSICVCLMDH